MGARRVVVTTAGAAAGWSAWSLSEYVLHRWAMHGPWKGQPMASEHIAHHRRPLATDPVLRSLTYVPAVLGGVGVGAVATRLLDRAGGVATWFGFAVGYAAYEQLHWRAHHRRPIGSVERRIHERHAAHHAGASRNFGVTTAIWDRLFATDARRLRAV